MTSSISDRVRGIAADVFGVPQDQINAQASREEMEKWDSMQHLNLVLALEQHFAVQFEPEEIEQMHSITEIAHLLQSKLDQRN